MLWVWDYLTYCTQNKFVGRFVGWILSKRTLMVREAQTIHQNHCFLLCTIYPSAPAQWTLANYPDLLANNPTSYILLQTRRVGQHTLRVLNYYWTPSDFHAGRKTRARYHHKIRETFDNISSISGNVFSWKKIYFQALDTLDCDLLKQQSATNCSTASVWGR